MVLSLPEWIAALLHAEALISYWLVGAESNHLRLMLFSYHVKLGMTQFLLNEEKIRDAALQLSQVTGILFPAVSCALEHWARMLQDREMCLALSHTSEHAAGSAQEVDFTHACSSSKQKATSEHTCNRAGVCSFTSRMKVLWKAMNFMIRTTEVQDSCVVVAEGNECFLSQVSFTPARTQTALCVRGTKNCLATFVCQWKMSC